MYLDLLDDPYWRVSALEAITAWMQDEPARVELVLLGKEPVNCLTKCFVQSSSQSYERILDPFLKIMRHSPALTSALVSPTFLARLAETLERQTKAGITLNLLRITRLVLESHPQRTTLVPRYKFDTIVKRLARQNDPVLVRELAQQVYPILVAGTLPAPLPSAVEPVKRKISAVRRKSSDAGAGAGSGSPILSHSHSHGLGHSYSHSHSHSHSHSLAHSTAGQPTARRLAHSRTASDEIRRSVLGPPLHENGTSMSDPDIGRGLGMGTSTSADGIRRTKSAIPRNINVR